MSNYSEELAYWYLRLNGFFPITDYCEVKTGDYDITELFPEERIKYCLRRFGLDHETPIINPLTVIENALSRFESAFFKKVLIANKKKNNVDEKAIFIDLNSAILFICNRFKKYDAHKYGSRMFFDSSLTQLLIHLVHNPSLIEDINS